MKTDNRNFILFAVIAALILFGWPVIANRLFPPANPPVTKIEDGKSKVVPNTTAPSPTTAAKTRDLKAVLGESVGQRVTIDTPTLKGSINLKGARIDDLVLSQYGETIAKDSPPIRLLSPAGTADAYFAQFGWQDTGLKAPNADTLWTANGTTLAPGKPVTLTAANGQGQVFGIELAVDGEYMFTIKQTVVNKGGSAINVAPFGQVIRTNAGHDLDSWTIHVGPIGVFNKGANYDVGYHNLTGEKPGFFAKLFGTTARAGDNYFDATGGWAGFGDKYWLAALIPDQGAPVRAGFAKADKTKPTYQADVLRQPVSLAPGKALTQSSRFFAGAKIVRVLDGYQDNQGVKLLGRANDWGWFEIIEKPIFYYLDWLFRMVGNFGVAIMLLTVTIRGLIFPIAQRQFASMASMRAIQPKMKALQERYKDDKPRQQQEIMKLYKTEKVNPLAGCLPTLIQIPIMYSLYKVLMLTIEMRHQPFVAWIKDLSAPDPLTPINLFGYLDFVPPHWIAIGVVPILLGISMWLQFRMNPAPMDEAQKQVFALMPWVLMFVMAPFAVGLQVYWITSNLLTVLQQKVLYARHPALKEAVVK